MDTLSVTMVLWNREPSILHNALFTLAGQTVKPSEIVVVAMSPDPAQREMIHAICDNYELARMIDAPRETFSLSWGMNVAIRRTREDSRYVMATCPEMLFSPNMLEVILNHAGPNIFVFSACCFLPQTVPVESPQWALENWDWLLEQIEPKPPRPCSTGTLLVQARERWFHMRGYDEVRRPFAYCDGDLSYRGRLMGGKEYSVQWIEAQAIHPWHEPSPLVYELGGIWPLDDELDPVRNPDGWGEL